MIGTEELQEALSTSQSDVINMILERRYIISYGVVTDVVDEGLVSVLCSVAQGAQGIMTMVCVLANLASDTLTVNVVPKAGDKVLVLCPNLFDPDMFDPEQKETIVNERAHGYSPLYSIAIPINQYKTNAHKNTVTFEDGTVKAKLAYDKDNDKNNAELDINADGSLTYKNPNTTLTVSAEGDISIETKGKFSFKNDTTDLKTVLSDLATQIKNLQTYGSPALHSVMPSSQTAISNWESSELNALME